MSTKDTLNEAAEAADEAKADAKSLMANPWVKWGVVVAAAAVVTAIAVPVVRKLLSDDAADAVVGAVHDAAQATANATE